MYHHSPDASKRAFARLVEFANERDFRFIDAQTPSAHLQRLGAERVSRSDFLTQLEDALASDSLIGSWAAFA